MRVNRYTQTVIMPRAVPNMVDEGAVRSAGSTAQIVAGAADMGFNYLEKERQAVNATKVNGAVISYKKDLLDASESFRQENMATPEDSSKRFEEVSREISQQYADSLEDEQAKQAFQSTVKNVDLGVYESNLKWERDRNVTLSAERTEDAAQNINTISYRKGQSGESLDDVFKDIQATAIAERTFLAPEVIANSIETMEKGAVTNYLQAQLDAGSHGDVKKALDSGKYDDMLGADGLKRAYDGVKTVKKQQEAEYKARVAKEDAIIESRVDLALEQAETPQQIAKVSYEIDALEERMGEAWANDYRVKIEKANDKYLEEQGDIQAGALFATGQAALNPEDSKHRKAADSYYKAFTQTPEFADLQPQEKNMAIAEMVKNTSYVPKTLKGEIAAAARSQDENIIKQVADLKNTISKNAPYILPQLGSEQDLRRLDMINSRIDAGVPAGQAIKTVDERLDPANAPQEQQIKAEIENIIKTDKIDFRNKVVQAFSTTGDWFAGFVGGGIEDTGPIVSRLLDDAAAEGRVIWEDEYRISRDKDRADKKLQEKMSLWGRTEINGSPMATKFPIEDYYGIENQDSDWIRGQAVESIMELEKGGFNPRSKKDLEKNLYIVPHPKVTPQTAATGQPRYSLIYQDPDTGTPMDLLLGDVWYPDTAKERADLVKGKKKPDEFSAPNIMMRLD